MSRSAFVLTLSIVVGSCGSHGEEARAPTASTAPVAAVEPAPSAPAAAPADEEACASVIVVAWQGAEHASESITRSTSDARALAESLLQRVEAGEDFAAVARAHSDARASAPRGGLLGTYTHADWPAAHRPIESLVWGLGVDQISQVVEAPYGWVIARRCPLEYVHTRHILVRYAGARDAGADAQRSRQDAHDLAYTLWNEITNGHADFAAMAREHSEDASAERGGDIGRTGRGRLAPAYEAAAFAALPSQVPPPVETEFGFHVMQRIE